MPAEEAERLLIDFVRRSAIISPGEGLEVVAEDPENDTFLECAVAARATHICSD